MDIDFYKASRKVKPSLSPGCCMSDFTDSIGIMKKKYAMCTMFLLILRLTYGQCHITIDHSRGHMAPQPTRLEGLLTVVFEHKPLLLSYLKHPKGVLSKCCK